MCSLIDILQWKKNQKDSDDFWHRKLTLKVKFWYFLTAPHYSNFQNLVISFKYSWFLAKNLSNFVSLPWKLHNRYCHNLQAVHHQAVHHAEPVVQAYEPTEDVVDIAVGNKDFSTLVKIVSDLGLVETLKNAEAVTIFAPNDAAFAKLPAGTLESLTPEQVKSNTFYPI